MKGRVHSIQSLGAVDGPGVRYVVFLQGCPLRCAYCHNPDTWDFSGGQEREAAELVQEICRYKMYFGDKGGVTVSGGEPLMQPAFVGELFRLLHGEGIHTALDTSGVGNLEAARRVLEHTDLILGDLKFATREEYKTHCKADMEKILSFYRLAAELNVPLWVRHVVVPGRTDSPQAMAGLKAYIGSHLANVQKVELLPYHLLGVPKYQRMGLPDPLPGVPAMDKARCAELQQRFFPENG